MWWRNYFKTFFEKIKNEHISGTITWRFTQFFFFIGCQVEGYGNIMKLSCRPLAFTTYDAFFKKNKKRSGTSLRFFYMTNKSRLKFKYFEHEKSFSDAFFIIFKELSLKQIKQFFLEGESSTLKVKWYLNSKNRGFMYRFDT